MSTALASILLAALPVAPGHAPADPDVEFTAASSAELENVGSVAIEVQLSATHTLDVEVPYTFSGTALVGLDYTHAASPLVIPAGQLTGDIVIDVVNNATLEPDETVVLTLGTPVNGNLGAGVTHTFTILNDDAPIGQNGRNTVVRPLTFSPETTSLAATRVGDVSAAQQISLVNGGTKPLRVDALQFDGADAASFLVTPSVALPVVLAAGQSLPVDVQFAPGEAGPHFARLTAKQTPHAHLTLGAAVTGIGFGLPGEEYLINIGGTDLAASQGGTFIEDFGYSAPGEVVQYFGAAITNTTEPLVYRTGRAAPLQHWEWPLPNGSYLVKFMFAETKYGAPDKRVFDVDVEGQSVRKNLDIYQLAGFAAALEIAHVVDVTDGKLDVDLLASVDFTILNGIQVASLGKLAASPASIDFGVVDAGQVDQVAVTLENIGLNASSTNSLSIEPVMGDATDFTVEVGGSFYGGAAFTTSHAISFTLQPGEIEPVTFYFSPSEHGFHDLRVQFRGDHPTLEMVVEGGAGVGGDPYLHPVIVIPDIVVDYDLSGSEDTVLDGSGSHTHEPGHGLTGWEWRESGSLISSNEVATLPFATGLHTVELTIIDDNVPAHTLATTADFEVLGVDEVPGVLAHYYVPGSGLTPVDLLDAVPAVADYVEARSAFSVDEENGIGGSGLLTDVMVRLVAQLEVVGAGTYDFSALGGHDTRIEIDGVPYAGPLALGAGSYDLEVRWAVASTLETPLELQSDIGGAGLASIDPSLLTHDLRDTPPTINSMPSEGINLGGNQVLIRGFGFFPQDQVVLHWGNQDLTEADFVAWSAEVIEIVSPPGSGIIDVTIETPVGVSGVSTFEYKADGPVPVVFNQGPIVGVNLPTVAEWGPDGRLYVGALDGWLHAMTFNDDYTLASVQAYPGVSMRSNPAILGLAFDPYDHASGTVSIYVGHSELYAQGGGAFTGPAPYPGAVSRLDGPNFDTPVPVVTGLPTSNHDHAVNGLVFDANGDILLCLGSNTNAGIVHPNIGNLPESPLSAAIVKVELTDPNFDGDLVYLETSGGAVNMDQVFGEVVDLAPGKSVSVHAAGIRNPLNLVLTTWGDLYAPDNGPNSSFGVASTSATSQTPFHASDIDEIVRVEYGRYYGSPNRNRGRYNPIENKWFKSTDAEVPGFTQALTQVFSSMNGLVEYRANTFNEQLRGDLIAQQFNGGMWHIALDEDHETVTSVVSMQIFSSALNLATGPGGAIVAIDYQSGVIVPYLPQDIGAIGLTAYDIYPWRAPAGGGGTFVIGGSGFGTLGDTTVTIAGNTASLTSVSPNRIVGTIPGNGGPSADLEDVVVTVGAGSSVIRKAFQYLPATPGLVKGKWTSEPSMPVPLGEVASAAIGGKLFVVGETSVKTLAYDFATDTWDDTLAVRPFVGHHHASEVYGGKWYLIGGLGAGQGKVQIYDPVQNTWSTGANMPWQGGSVSTCAIGDRIYAAGGIVGSTTVDDCAVYDITTNSWTSRQAMPFNKGRNHAGSATDGVNFYVFGGRGVGSGAGNFVANGFDDVQIYDPQSDSWSTSFDPGSTIPPLPIGRGGMGRAVFYKGEFYVFGGETFNGPGATAGNVYDRVDVYDPVTQSWRLEAPIPTPRHGLSPVIWQGRVYLAGGGVVAGFSNSDVFESFYKP